MYDSAQEVSFLQSDRKRRKDERWHRQGRWMRSSRKISKGICALCMALVIGGVSLVVTERVWMQSEMVRVEAAEHEMIQVKAAEQDMIRIEEAEREMISVGSEGNDSEEWEVETISGNIVSAEEEEEDTKIMYLTFDDGPTKENTGRVLDILKERNIKATFFVVGENVRKNPEIAKRIAEEGHAIGIHCNNHDYATLYQSVDAYVKDFEEARQAVLEVTGVDTKMFRFPGGSVNAHNKKVSDAIITEMTNRGYIYYDWNASLEDAVKDPKPEQLIANAVDSTLGRKKVIMLAHDTVYTTGICLNELLDQLPEYRMEVLTENVEPIQF